MIAGSLAPADVRVRNEGTVVAFHPRTAVARAWITENVETEPWQWLGQSVVVEHRFASELVVGMLRAGLIVEGD